MAILVYDDLFTDGQVLNEVARALIEDGDGERVCGMNSRGRRGSGSACDASTDSILTHDQVAVDSGQLPRGSATLVCFEIDRRRIFERVRSARDPGSRSRSGPHRAQSSSGRRELASASHVAQPAASWTMTSWTRSADAIVGSP